MCSRRARGSSPVSPALTVQSLAVVNDAHEALLARLRHIIEETPTSGALNAAKQPYHPTRFAGAVERRSGEGAKLVEYMREKVYEGPTDGYDALIAAGRPDLTAEAVVADSDGPWASLFTEADRTAARARLGAMQRAHQQVLEAAEAIEVEHDREIVALANRSRTAKGMPALTEEQKADMMARRAAQRVSKT
jgi:hypothetical protein